jgi:hypothetical protein
MVGRDAVLEACSSKARVFSRFRLFLSDIETQLRLHYLSSYTSTIHSKSSCDSYRRDEMSIINI